MSTFKIEGNNLKYKYYKRVMEREQRKVRKYEDTVVDITNIIITN